MPARLKTKVDACQKPRLDNLIQHHKDHPAPAS